MNVYIDPYRYAAAAPPTVTLENTNTKTTSLSGTYAFNFASSHAAGAVIVFAVTGRQTAAFNWASTATDSAGNTYTKRVEGTQSNGLTVTAIYDCVLTNAVTSATTITTTNTATSPATAQHATIFTLTGVTGYDSSAQGATTSATVPNSVTTGGPFTGVAIHAISTGASTAPTVSSVSAGWTSQSSLRVNACSQYTATKPSTSWADPVSNSFGMSASANYAGVIAYYA
jgi:hypothetical protein